MFSLGMVAIPVVITVLIALNYLEYQDWNNSVILSNFKAVKNHSGQEVFLIAILHGQVNLKNPILFTKWILIKVKPFFLLGKLRVGDNIFPKELLKDYEGYYADGLLHLETFHVPYGLSAVHCCWKEAFSQLLLLLIYNLTVASTWRSAFGKLCLYIYVVLFGLGLK